MSGNRIVVEALEREILDGVPVRDEDGQTVDRRRLDVGLIPWFSDERPLRGLGAFIDWRRCGRVSKLIRDGFCDGDPSESVLLVGGHGLPVERLVFVGLGSGAGFDRNAVDGAARRIVEVTRGLVPRDVLLAMPDWLPERALVEALFSAIVVELRNPLAAVTPIGIATGNRPGGDTDSAPQAPSSVDPSGPDADTPGQGDVQSGRPTVVRSADAPAEDATEMPPPLAFAPQPPWWIVAESGNMARLRRLLEGPPRAAAES